MITLEALEVIDAIDRKGSFAAAANILYKVPSAITYTVQKLESDLGVVLFEKDGRRSVLTPAGKVLLEQGRELLEAAARVTEATKMAASGWESTINISIDNALGTDIIYPALKEFFQIKPDIEVNLYQEVLAGGWDALQEGRSDLAIGVPEKPADVSGFVYKPFKKTEWVFAASPDHPLSQLRRTLTTKDIENYRAIVIRDTSLSHAKITNRLFSTQPVMTVQTIQEKVQAQVGGLGIGYLPIAEISDQLSAGKLRALEVEGVEVITNHFIAWKRGKKGKALRWFIDYLCGTFDISSS